MSLIISHLSAMVAVIVFIILGSVVFTALAAPAYTATVTLDQIDGDGDADFWIVDYFDTNGRGDANDPTTSLTTPPTTVQVFASDINGLAGDNTDF